MALVVVGASVLIGVFGPRLQERNPSQLTPLADVADAARQIQFAMQFDAIHRPAGAHVPTRAQIADLIESSLKSAWRPPDLAPLGFVAILAGPATLPGSDASIAILYEREGDTIESSRFLALFVTLDHGRYASFDEFGRIEPLRTNRSIIERDDPTDPDSSATMVFSDGDLLFTARADDQSALESLVDELGAP